MKYGFEIDKENRDYIGWKREFSFLTLWLWFQSWNNTQDRRKNLMIANV